MTIDTAQSIAIGILALFVGGEGVLIYYMACAGRALSESQIHLLEALAREEKP